MDTRYKSIFGFNENAAVARKLARLIGGVFAGDGLSRNELADNLGFSRGSVSELTEALLRRGALEEGEAIASGRGRARVPLRVNGTKCYAAGVFFRGEIEVILLDAAKNVLAQKLFAVEPEMGASVKTALAVTSLESLIRETGLSRDRLVGVGVSLPGILNPESGRVKRASQFFRESDFDILAPFRERFGVPCRLYNDNPLMTMMEKVYGDAKEMHSFLYMHGDGLGMFLNGRVYEGHHRRGGELGFLQIDPNGPIGTDGRQGLINSVKPLGAINLPVQKVIENGGISLISRWWDRQKDPILPLELVIRGAGEGDALCQKYLRGAFETLSEVVVGLIYIFSPEAFFLPPWTADCPEVTLDVVRQKAALCRVVNDEWRVEILPARKGRESIAFAAALQSLYHFFGVETYF